MIIIFSPKSKPSTVATICELLRISYKSWRIKWRQCLLKNSSSVSKSGNNVFVEVEFLKEKYFDLQLSNCDSRRCILDQSDIVYIKHFREPKKKNQFKNKNEILMYECFSWIVFVIRIQWFIAVGYHPLVSRLVEEDIRSDVIMGL